MSAIVGGNLIKMIKVDVDLNFSHKNRHLFTPVNINSSRLKGRSHINYSASQKRGLEILM